MTVRRRSLLITLVWVLGIHAVVASGVWADEPDAGKDSVNLDEAIRLALLVSPEILLAKFDVLDAEIALKEAEINQLAGHPASELDDAARALVEAQDTFVDTISEVALQVQEAYYQVIRSAELNETQQKMNEQTERQVAVAMTRFEAGLIAKHEIDEVTLQSDQSAIETAAALERHEDTVRELTLLLGLDEPVQIDRSDIEISFQPLTITLDEALAEAFATRREISAAQRSVDSAERRLKLAEATYAPPVEITRLEMDVERAEIGLARAEVTVAQDIRGSYRSLQHAATQVSLRRREEELAKRRLEITTVRYDAGLIPLSDLVSAERAVSQAALDVAGTIWDYNGERVAFLKKIGRIELPPLPGEIKEFISRWND